MGQEILSTCYMCCFIDESVFFLILKNMLCIISILKQETFGNNFLFFTKCNKPIEQLMKANLKSKNRLIKFILLAVILPSWLHKDIRLPGVLYACWKIFCFVS